MKPEFENIPLNKNENKKRFEIEINGHFAFIDFVETENQISLIHTEAEPELAGTGAATAVVEKTLEYIKKAINYCCHFAHTFSPTSENIPNGKQL